MTTAARPTFLPAVGGHSLNDTRVAPKSTTSVYDLPSQTKLKKRDLEEKLFEEDRDTLRKKLEEKEQKHLEAAKLIKTVPVEEDETFEERRRLLQAEQLDADDSTDEEDDEDDSDEDSSDEEDEDDTAELLRELEKIKKERQEEKERLEREKQEQEEREKEERALSGNPLLNPEANGFASSVSSGSQFTVKRRWDDDVIFKNQARDAEDIGKKKRFINDMLRSDFHRKFMDKYIK